MPRNNVKLTPVEQQVQNMQEKQQKCTTCEYLCIFRSGGRFCELGQDVGKVMDGLARCRWHSGK